MRGSKRRELLDRAALRVGASIQLLVSIFSFSAARMLSISSCICRSLSGG